MAAFDWTGIPPRFLDRNFGESDWLQPISLPQGDGISLQTPILTASFGFESNNNSVEKQEEVRQSEGLY